MPRFVIERDLSAGFPVPGSAGWRELVERNADAGVTWLHSYVSEDGQRAFCVYEGRTPEAVRRASALNALPIVRITQIRVLDPYLYEWHGSRDRARHNNRRS
jgi:hypothetical protein